MLQLKGNCVGGGGDFVLHSPQRSGTFRESCANALIGIV